MSDLITRLEAATEGSRKLDAFIMATVKSTPDGWAYIGPVPQYTTSLDAALTLVPEGWFVWHIGQTEPGDDWSVILNNSAHRGVDIEFIGTTLPLALCIAALKARGL